MFVCVTNLLSFLCQDRFMFTQILVVINGYLTLSGRLVIFGHICYS